jgi:hypothetical protein
VQNAKQVGKRGKSECPNGGVVRVAEEYEEYSLSMQHFHHGVLINVLTSTYEYP